MNFFDLKTGYIVAAFPDFESAFAATEDYSGQGFKTVYLNEVSHVQEGEVVEYVLKYESQRKFYFHNYHASKSNDLKLTATDSLRTALEVLEQKNRLAAKFLVIVAPKKASRNNPKELTKAISQFKAVEVPVKHAR
ncbi:hypothetical protein [Pontibacter beigongshangensis]|uniref:hypothetical protein n=1 Tax=Pontibacter beigongshangensis TaxID=2574733 RepID=UPI00165010E3|nr:hypothetical protein [Pontibacter beigongshangensis]